MNRMPAMLHKLGIKPRDKSLEPYATNPLTCTKPLKKQREDRINNDEDIGKFYKLFTGN